MSMEPSDPVPSYVAQQPPGVFGPARWAVYAAGGTLLTMFEPRETRDDVRRWLAAKGLDVLASGDIVRSDDPAPRPADGPGMTP